MSAPRKAKASKTKSSTKPSTGQTKQSKILKMLQRPAGATIPAIVKATNWQHHSVRGFLTAVVRKRLELPLTSTVDGNKRVYRIAMREAK